MSVLLYENPQLGSSILESTHSLKYGLWDGSSKNVYRVGTPNGNLVEWMNGKRRDNVVIGVDPNMKKGKAIDQIKKQVSMGRRTGIQLKRMGLCQLKK